MLFAVAEVVLQMVALGLERIVVLVLDLPARATGGDDISDILVRDREVGGVIALW